MNRLDLKDDAYSAVIEQLGFLPSTCEKVGMSLVMFMNIRSVKDLCMAKKEKLLDYTSYNKKLVKAISEYLGDHGLRLGMTEEELYDYLDEAYLEEKAYAAAKAKAEFEQAEKQAELERRRKKDEADNDRKFMIIIFFLSFLGTLSATTLMLWISILVDLFI